MEPKLAKVNVKKCSSKEETQEELILGLLKNESMPLQVLVTIIMSEPYELSSKEIIQALSRLNRKNLIRMNNFVPSWITGSEIDVRLKTVS